MQSMRRMGEPPEQTALAITNLRPRSACARALAMHPLNLSATAAILVCAVSITPFVTVGLGAWWLAVWYASGSTRIQRAVHRDRIRSERDARRSSREERCERAQVSRDGLAHEKCATQVGVEDGVPIGLCLIEYWLVDGDAGVVDQDVEAPEMFDRPSHARINCVGRSGDVQHQRRSSPAVRNDISDQLIEKRSSPRRDDDTRTGSSQNLGEVTAQPARGSGNQSHFAREIEGARS